MSTQNQPLERLRRLQLVTDVALSHLELDELLSELLVRVRDTLETDTVAVLMLDEATDELVARAALGIEEEVEQGVRIPVGGGFAGRVAASKSPVYLSDVDHAAVLNPILREKGIKSLLGVPLMVAGEVLGVLHVGTLRPRDFTGEDIELLQLVADRVALAVDHARAFEAERIARVRLEGVQAVTDIALSHLELLPLLDALLPRISEIIHVDTVAVLLVDRETDELVATSALGIEEEVVQGVRIPVGGGFAGRIAATKAPVILPDVDTAHVLNPILREKGIKSLLGVPLVVRDAAIGVLHVGALVHRNFTPADVEFLQLVAERVAIAVERAQLHEQMIELDQLKLNFVAVASHELRTPATSVYGIIATLRERGDTLAGDVREQLQDVLFEQALRLRRLIEQLLDLSRLDAETIRIEPRRLALASFLPMLVRTLSVADVPVPARIEVEEGLEASVDPDALERIVSNLVVNAYRYGEPPVTLAAHRSDTHLRISVEDNGPGVPADLQPRLFDRFERGTLASEGSGLGLSIARAYARAHGGELVYDPRGGGARFEFVLPLGR
jgi:signal transduction histidine kinase